MNLWFAIWGYFTLKLVVILALIDGISVPTLVVWVAADVFVVVGCGAYQLAKRFLEDTPAPRVPWT